MTMKTHKEKEKYNYSKINFLATSNENVVNECADGLITCTGLNHNV